MNEWKTYSLAAGIIVLTAVLVALKILPAEAWWQGCTVGAGLYGARTVADKMTRSKTTDTLPTP